MLAGCYGEAPVPVDATGEMEIPAPAGSVAAEAERDCLLVVWDKQEEPDREFDRANDLVEGGLISCATGTSASQYEATLATLRAAASGNNPDAMLGELGIPLLYIDADGNRRDLRESELASTTFAEVFSPEMLTLIRGLKLTDMTVVPEQGGFFELGALWLRPGEPGGRPHIVTVNRQALSEAAAATQEAETSS